MNIVTDIPQNKIPAERLKEGTTVLVRGRVTFSRLTRHIEGAELARRVAEAKAAGALYPTSRPHTTISLVDPQVIQLGDQPTLEEQFAAQKIYTLKKGENAGRRGFSIDSTSTNLPLVFAPNAEGKHEQLVLENDLASGMDVTLVINVFKPQDYEKRGLGLNQVVLNEPVRYYQGAGVTNDALAALGITITGPVNRVPAPSAGDTASEIPTVADESGLPMPGLTPSAPVQTQAPVAPAQPQAPAAPVQPQAMDNAAHIAALQAQLAQAQAAAAQPGGSAFDAGASAFGGENAGIRFGE